MAAIEEHSAAEVNRSGGAKNPPPETSFHQVGDITRVIDMGMRQDHNVNTRGLKREVPVPSAGLLPLPLIQAAVEKNLGPVYRDQML